MANCYNCKAELTAINTTEEHVFLNACGGRLKSKKLLCKTCNSRFGNSFDKALASSTNDLTNFLFVKRQKGNPQPIRGKSSVSGEEYAIEPGGNPIKLKPKIIVEKTSDGLKLNISANDEKQFTQILKGLKRKYPKLDIEYVFKSATRGQYYLDEPIQIHTDVGGPDVFKSITKTAINFYLLHRGDRSYIKHLLPYLMGEEEQNIVWFHYPKTAPYKPNSKEVSHVIRILGDSQEKILYAYIELFNVQNFIVLLNTEYSGDNLQHDYIFDLIKVQEIKNEISLKYTRTELIDLLVNKDQNPHSSIQERYNRVFHVADTRQDSFHRKKLISKAIQNSLGQLPEGTIITKEIIQETARKITDEMMPYIAHRLGIKNKRNN